MKYASSIQSVLRHAPIGELLPAGFAAFLSSLSSILLLATSAYLIASAALHPPLYTLALAITLVRACGLGRAVFRYLDRWLSHRAVFHAQERLRLRLYEKASALLPLKELRCPAGFLPEIPDASDDYPPSMPDGNPAPLSRCRSHSPPAPPSLAAPPSASRSSGQGGQ